MEQKNKKTISKTIPNSFEAEQAILACILLDENSSVNILPYMKVFDFYHNSHKVIFENMFELYKNNQPVDFITLTSKLEQNNQLELVGGIDYINTLTNLLPSASNYGHYMDIVKNASRQRLLIQASQEIIENCFETSDGRASMEVAEKKIFEIAQNEEISDLKQMTLALPKVIEKFEKIARDQTVLRGIPTGLKALDEITGGLQNSDLIILAARPGVGKTTLAMNIVNNAALLSKKSCAVFSLEMPIEQLTQRALCSVGCVSMTKALKGQLNEEEWIKIWKANKELNNAKIFIDDNGLTTPMDIRSKCRRLKREQGLDLVMIDYLGLMSSGSTKKDLNKTNEIAEITRNLKITAKELNVPIILLCQLSRSVESREDHHPMLSDLRDSGAIEQDADVIMFIYNPDKYNDIPNEEGKGIIDLDIAKHRNGKIGTVKLRWISEWNKFVDIDYKSSDLPKPTVEKPVQQKSEEQEETPENVFAEESEETSFYADDTEDEEWKMKNLPK